MWVWEKGMKIIITLPNFRYVTTTSDLLNELVVLNFPLGIFQ